MQRILFLVACDIDLTGTPVFIRDLIDGLDEESEMKCEYYVYTPGLIKRNIYSQSVKLIEGKIKQIGVKSCPHIWKDLSRRFKNQSFDVVHINTSNVYLAAVYSKFFSMKGSRVICHSHNIIEYNKNLLQRLLVEVSKKVIVRNSETLFACSEDAGVSMYGKKERFTVVNNFVDLERFKYSEHERIRIRKECAHRYLLGHIGAFNGQKNQRFIIDVVNKLGYDYGLVLIGSGAEQETLKEYCVQERIRNVYFLNTCPDVGKYYSAFDVFLFPSLYEGFGRVLLEAEVSGLKKIASDNVPRSNAFECTYLPLVQNLWVDEIRKSCATLEKRCNRHELIKKAGYDKESVVRQLCKAYRGFS